MLDRLKRARRVYQWLEGRSQRDDPFRALSRSDYKDPKVLTGTMLSRLNLHSKPCALRDVEFQVFSQFGDDGIIQYLVHTLPIEERTFVEFGVEDYTESNTRFLLFKDKWEGLVIDGGKQNIDYINRDPASKLFNLRARQAFITAENINDLLAEGGMRGRIGLLSVDIDGVDYWVWKAITVADPAIVVVEYNAVFGSDRAITVPYQADFNRTAAHPSLQYWGASLAAFQHLASQKDYLFAGCNGNGNNAYFIRKDFGGLPQIEGLEKTYQPAAFAEAIVEGRRLRGTQALDVIRGLPVFNVHTAMTEPL